MTAFPEDFQKLLSESVGPERTDLVLEALREEPSVSIRLNPSKLKECPFPHATALPWNPLGYLLAERPVFTLDPLFHAGGYYVQDSSAMFVGHVFRQTSGYLVPGAAVLDLCAAPGGKTTDLSASLRARMGDRYLLVANEVMRSRYGILAANVSTWGDPCTATVSRDPSAFGGTPLFDYILADVPCSGEGMFRKDPKALQEWSLRNVDFCAARARRILTDIWPTLKEGGVLLYSTCTFNRRENDDTVAWAASALGADIIPPEAFPPAVETRCGQVLLPGLVPGEGQYVAALRKKGTYNPVRTAGAQALLRTGKPAGAPPEYPRWEVDRKTALQYLHGDALVLEAGAPTGFVTLCYKGLPLGPAKNLGKRCNNLYPKNKRIRMDIR